jgi:hypothetical protein
MMTGSIGPPMLHLRYRKRDETQRSQPYRRRRLDVLLENKDAVIYGAGDPPVPRVTGTSSAKELPTFPQRACS